MVNEITYITFIDTGFDKLEQKLNKHKFDIDSVYDEKDNITRCKITGNDYNTLMSVLIDLENSTETLLVGGKSFHNSKKNSIDANYAINIEGDRIHLSYSGIESNIVSLPQKTINLFNLLKDNNYETKISYQDKKIKFFVEGGQGVDTLSDLIWKSEQGMIDTPFEIIPYADDEGYIRKLHIFETKNSLIEYLGGERYE